MDALEICALKLGAFPPCSTVRRLPGAEAGHAGPVRRAEDTRLGRRREPRVSRRKMAFIRMEIKIGRGAEKGGLDNARRGSHKPQKCDFQIRTRESGNLISFFPSPSLLSDFTPRVHLKSRPICTSTASPSPAWDPTRLSLREGRRGSLAVAAGCEMGLADGELISRLIGGHPIE